MDTNDIIKTTMIAGLGLVISSSSTEPKRFHITSDSDVENSVPFVESTNPSSTRFNNSERFSLEQLKNNKRKLKSLKKLSQNWNGYDGESFDSGLISKVETILSDLDYQPQIFPTGRGTIQVEKYLDENNLIEIEISKDEIFAYQVKDGEELEEEISLDQVNQLISALYA